MLTRVMEFLQSQDSQNKEGGDGAEGGLAFDPEGIKQMLDRAAREKEALEQTLAEFEEESKQLHASLTAANARCEDLQRSNRDLERQVELSQGELEAVRSDLDEKTDMLTRVMSFLQVTNGERRGRRRRK